VKIVIIEHLTWITISCPITPYDETDEDNRDANNQLTSGVNS